MLPEPHAHAQALAHARACFLHACALDVAVFKPGNVSSASPGHGMSAAQFIAASQAAAPALFEAGSGVGERIESAAAASWAATGCNTNLGILLLCAPIALATQRSPGAHSAASLRSANTEVLGSLDLDDAAAAFRGIALANPGGLGEAAEQDVHALPTLDLRAAMALAADRDLIARQYRDGYADLFDLALPSLPTGFKLGNCLSTAEADASADPLSTRAVQHLYLTLLSRLPDSHIVRKHGEAVAQNVMREAQAFAVRSQSGESLAVDPAFMAWDAALKAARINPGTTADMTVAALMLAGLTRPARALSHRPV